MDKILGSGMGLGLTGSLLSNLEILNELCGIIAALVSITCALILLRWKYKERKNKK